jgi:hypothetical protein
LPLLQKPLQQKAAQAAFFMCALCISVSGFFALPRVAIAQKTMDVAQLGALLGADEAAVQQAYPDLRKTARPLPGPRGTRGLWSLSDTVVAGMTFETVFYFKARRLERIEQRKLVAPSECGRQFDLLTTALEARLGTAVRSSESQGSASRSAAWGLDTYRVAAYQTNTQTQAAGSCTVMLTHEPLSAKDAAEL